MTRKLYLVCIFSLVLSLFAACSSTTQPTDGTATNAQEVAKEPAKESSNQAAASDLLADITARGVLRISTDPAYPPQSELVADAKKPADSKCSGSEEHAAAEFVGFDIDVASEIAKRLGVEPCFVTVDWTLIVSGGWSGRWDISVGSMAITPERMEKLYFTQPYYTTPAALFVHADNKSVNAPVDASGKKVGACTGCTYETYLNDKLVIPGEQIELVIKDATVQGYETDGLALEDLALGDGTRLDAVLTALPTGANTIKDGKPLKQVGEPLFYEYNATAIDKSSALDTASFRSKVTEIIQAMHSDGTLKSLSDKHYALDLVSSAGKFDLAGLEQK
jgi:polar amino acid transport system substrate-binding protein